LKDHVLGPLIKALANGEDKRGLAEKHSVSVQTVTRLLLTEPGLHQRWSLVRFQKAQTQSRLAWKALMVSIPSASSIIWRKLDPAAYAWLYRWDRGWLQDAIANRPEPPHISPMRRDWTTRDQLLSQSVQKAGFDWFSVHFKGHPTLAELCAQVQGLRQVLSVLHKLPRTQLAIREVCAARRRSAESRAQSTLAGIDDSALVRPRLGSRS
jgi:hypothetical protein